MNRALQHTQFRSQPRPARSRGAFTLVELLVSIALIFLLITVALMALKSAQRASSRTVSLNALKQMMVGYNGYQEEHKGYFLPGYVDAAMIGTGPGELNLKAELPTGEVLTPEDTSSYVWRMAPYLDNAWKTYMADYRSSEIESRLTVEYSCGNYDCPPPAPGGIFGPTGAGGDKLGIALRPSYGLNSIYLGGDTKHGDVALHPWADWPNSNPDRVAALRLSEVKNPSKIIVFAPTRDIESEALADTLGVNVQIGYMELCPPFANFDRNAQAALDLQWEFGMLPDGSTGIVLEDKGAEAGVPVDRIGDGKIPIAHLDGSVETVFIHSLGPGDAANITDMTRWSPFALTTN